MATSDLDLSLEALLGRPGEVRSRNHFNDRRRNVIFYMVRVNSVLVHSEAERKSRDLVQQLFNGQH